MSRIISEQKWRELNALAQRWKTTVLMYSEMKNEKALAAAKEEIFWMCGTSLEATLDMKDEPSPKEKECLLKALSDGHCEMLKLTEERDRLIAEVQALTHGKI